MREVLQSADQLVVFASASLSAQLHALTMFIASIVRCLLAGVAGEHARSAGSKRSASFLFQHQQQLAGDIICFLCFDRADRSHV